jgi:hypothetical protein
MKKSNFLKVLLTYFYRIGILAHIMAVFSLILAVIASGYIYNQYDLPAPIFLKRAAESLATDSSPVLSKVSVPLSYIASTMNTQKKVISNHVVYNSGIVGASIAQSRFKPKPQPLESNSRVSTFHQRLVNVEFTKLRTLKVSSSTELLNAIKQAMPGDDIVISPGNYYIKQQQIYLKQNGTKARPIRLSSENFDDVIISLDSLEGFVMKGDYWIVENLKITGVCVTDQQCEHAIHIVGAQQLIIRNNELTNFNSIVKANSTAVSKTGDRKFPDNILFEHNSLYNESSRKTNSSVTLLDVVTGSNWIVRKNFIANNSKHGSDYVSYALFLKGNGENGLIEQNIIDCEWSLANDNHTRVGVSLGGGGTGQQYCRGGSCPAEHSNGIIKNNLILNCSQDVGIYLNKARNSQVTHNTLLNSFGIDVRFKESSAIITNNITTSNIRTRNEGSMQLSGNVIEFDKALEKAFPSVISGVEFDLCGFSRFKFSSVGAVGSKCQKELALKTTSP